MKENDVKPRTIFVGLDLYYSQEYVDKLQTQLQQKENIIKEVREYIKEACWLDEVNKPNALGHKQTMKVLEILDGENNDK